MFPHFYFGGTGMTKILLRAVLLLAAGLAFMATPARADTRSSTEEMDEMEKKPVDLLIEARWVLPMTGENNIIENGAVAVNEGRIVAVGKAETLQQEYTPAKTIKGTDRVLMPGLVNGHTHAAMTLFRGMADDLELMEWLQKYIFPMEGKFVTPDFVAIGAELACYEMVQGGTTSIVDMYFYPDTSAQVFEKCGLRAILGAPMIDFPSPGFDGWEDSHAAGVDFVKRFKGQSTRVTPALAPHAPYTVSPEHLHQVVEDAKALGVPITMHLAESPSEMDFMKTTYDDTPVRHVAKQGMLDVPMIAAHVVWPDEEEIDMLAHSKVSAIHNPTSNMKLASGIAPVPALIKAGVPVGLGTDGAASNNDLDMWEEIRLAALLHKVNSGDPTALPAYEALEMATSMGAKAIGLGDEIGTLEVGKKADMIQVDMGATRLAPVYNIISHLVYVSDSEDVVTTIIDGRVIVEDGKVKTMDGAEIRKKADTKADEIRAALKAAGN